MGAFSIWHWLIVLAVALLLFGGGGKITRIMGDIGSGMRGFRKNLAGDDDDGKSTSIAARKSKSATKKASKKRASKKKSSTGS